MAALITVIIPVHNGERYLQQCLDSIPRLQEVEILVSDDASSDASLDIARQAGARCLVNPSTSGGPARAVNRALELCRTRWVTMLDADDWWPDGSLQARLERAHQQPTVEVVQGAVETICQGDIPPLASRYRPAAHFNVNLGACVFELETVRRLGGLDETLRYNSDADFFMRLWENNIPKAFLEKTCLYYRMHESNLSHDAPHPVRTQLLLLKRHNDRARLQGLSPQSDMAEYMGWTH